MYPEILHLRYYYKVGLVDCILLMLLLVSQLNLMIWLFFYVSVPMCTRAFVVFVVLVMVMVVVMVIRGDRNLIL